MEKWTKASEGKKSKKTWWVTHQDGLGCENSHHHHYTSPPPTSYLCDFPASRGSHVPAEALGSMWNLLPLVSEVGPAPGHPTITSSRTSWPSHVLPLSQPPSPAGAGKGSRTSACSCSPPAHRRWWARTKSLQFSGCSGWDHCCCWRSPANATACEWL